MRMRTRGITLTEVVVIVLIIMVLLAITIPNLLRSRCQSTPRSCPYNLSRMSTALRMYAEESPDNVFPPLSPIPGNWTVDTRKLNPEYLTDTRVLVCPSQPNASASAFRLHNNVEHPGARIGDPSADCVWSLSYIYTGYAISSDEQALALFDASCAAPIRSIFADLLLEVPVWQDAEAQTTNAVQRSIPVMWDRISFDPALDGPSFNHVPSGANVLYIDGHVEFLRFAYDNPSSMFPVTQIAAETFGGDVPQLSVDCYPR